MLCACGNSWAGVYKQQDIGRTGCCADDCLKEEKKCHTGWSRRGGEVDWVLGPSLPHAGSLSPTPPVRFLQEQARSTGEGEGIFDQYASCTFKDG